MDDLIQRYFVAGLSDLESGRLRLWRKAAPENEARFQALCRVWELSGPEVAGGRERPPSALEAVLTEAERRREDSIGSSARGLAGWWAAAAVAIVAISGGWFAWRQAGLFSPFSAAELSTGEKETVTVTLSDGSFVRLGPKSRLVLMPRRGSRDVLLEGLAYFAVAKDPSRPFHVRTRAGDATALGTRFEVRVEQDDLRLAVVEGRVALDAGGNRIEVGAGEVSHARGGAPPSVVKVEDIHAALDWPRGLLVFQATPLPEVAGELERHFGVRMVLTSPELSKRMVTAWFEDEKLEVVLTTVCRVTQTSCTLRGDSATLAP
ncbi:MAG: FecR domain-containing protein [Gemmatimonadota bacterium]